MFLASKICCVSLGTVRSTVLLSIQAVMGRKSRCGKGPTLTASWCGLALSWSGNHSNVATLYMVTDTEVGVVSVSVQKQVSWTFTVDIGNWVVIHCWLC